MVKKEIIWSNLAKLQFKAILEYYVERNGSENYSLKLVDEVEDVLNIGDEVEVKVTEIDEKGRVNLSRKVLLPKPEKVEKKEEK